MCIVEKFPRNEDNSKWTTVEGRTLLKMFQPVTSFLAIRADLTTSRKGQHKNNYGNESIPFSQCCFANIDVNCLPDQTVYGLVTYFEVKQ